MEKQGSIKEQIEAYERKYFDEKFAKSQHSLTGNQGVSGLR
jgi:hypothetical protein